MVDRRGQIDVTAQPPDLGEGFRFVDIAVTDLEHQGHGQGIAEIRVVLEGLYEGVILGKQI